MAVLGLILVLATGSLVAGLIVNNPQTTHFSVFGYGSYSLRPGALFVAGALAGLIFAIGLGLFFSGLRSAGRRRRERRHLVRTSREHGTLTEENDRLAAQLESERVARRRAENSPADAAGRGRDG